MKQSFQEISTTRTRQFQCSCGRKFQKTRKFCQTVNPFNQGPDGKPKTEAQIRDEINADAGAWTTTACATCGHWALEAR